MDERRRIAREGNDLYSNDTLLPFFYVDDIVVLSARKTVDQLRKFEKAVVANENFK